MFRIIYVLITVFLSFFTQNGTNYYKNNKKTYRKFNYFGKKLHIFILFDIFAALLIHLKHTKIYHHNTWSIHTLIDSARKSRESTYQFLPIMKEFTQILDPFIEDSRICGITLYLLYNRGPKNI